MKPVLLIALIALALAACGNAPAPPSQAAAPYAPTPTYNLAGQSVFVEATRQSFEKTEIAFSAAVAVATADAAATQQAANATAFTVATQSAMRETDTSFGKTQLAVTVSAQDTAIALGVTANAATLSPGQTQIAATATATAQFKQQQSDNFYWWVGAVFWVLLCAVILFYSWRILRSFARRVDLANNPRNIRALRLPAGTMLLIPLPGGGVRRELIPLPGAAVEVVGDFDDVPPDEEPEDIPVNGPGAGFTLFRREQVNTEHEANERNRRAVLRFLAQAIEVSGRDSDVIPRFDKLGVSAETWATCTELLSDQLEKIQGRNGGTFLRGRYETLGELAEAIGARRYMPRRTVEARASPAPANVPAAETMTPNV